MRLSCAEFVAVAVNASYAARCNAYGLLLCEECLSSSFLWFVHVLGCVCCSALTCKAAVDNALAETEAHREAHRQKERDLQIQTQASDQAAEQIPSMRYHYKRVLHTFAVCSLDTLWQVVLCMNMKR